MPTAAPAVEPEPRIPAGLADAARGRSPLERAIQVLIYERQPMTAHEIRARLQAWQLDPESIQLEPLLEGEALACGRVSWGPANGTYIAACHACGQVYPAARSASEADP